MLAKAYIDLQKDPGETVNLLKTAQAQRVQILLLGIYRVGAELLFLRGAKAASEQIDGNNLT